MIAAIQRRFQLAPESLRFHRQLNNNKKTCPGSGIDYQSMLEQVKAARTGLDSRDIAGDAPFPVNAAVSQETVARAMLALLSSPTEPFLEEPPEEKISRTESMSD